MMTVFSVSSLTDHPCSELRNGNIRSYLASLVDGSAASFHPPSLAANQIEQAVKWCGKMPVHKALRQPAVYTVQQGGQLGAQLLPLIMSDISWGP